MRTLLLFFCLGGFAQAEPPFPPSPAERERASCAAAIDDQLARLAPPPRLVGSDHAGGAAGRAVVDPGDRLRRLKAWLGNTSPDREAFTAAFNTLAQHDPLLARALRTLRNAGIPWEVQDLRNPNCELARGFFFAQPSPKVTLCAAGGSSLHTIRGIFIHETIHALQYAQVSPAPFFQHPQGPATTPLRYTMGAPFVDALNAAERSTHRAIGRLTAPNRANFAALEEAMAVLEKYYWYGWRDGHLTFTPKRTAGQTPAAWEAELSTSLNRRLQPGADPIAEMSFSRLIRDWARQHPALNNQSLAQRLQGLQEEIDRRYQAILVGPQGEEIGEVLRSGYFGFGRILNHLSTYCMEMQTQFFNALEEVNLARELQPFPACAATADDLLLAGPRGREKFTPGASPADLDAHLERHTRALLSHSSQTYGGTFDGLHGFEGHPEIFNAANCQRYRHDFLEAIPGINQ